MNKSVADIVERVVWTLLEALAGVVTVETFDLPPAWIPVVAVVLATLKSVVASRAIGVRGSAAVLPASLDNSVAPD